jgi:heme-degrading monooxygenase HmoA
MQARVARYEVGMDRIQDAIDAFGEAAKEIEQLDGFAGGYILVDHEDGRTMTITLWENDAALEESEKAARAARNKASEDVGGSVLSVEKFEVTHELEARTSGV